jgi:hypothetical protein
MWVVRFEGPVAGYQGNQAAVLKEKSSMARTGNVTARGQRG